MTFKESKPIYVQIAERLSDEILSGAYTADGRVPSVREYSALLEVNPNTTVKSYDLVTTRGIVYTMRGMGYFVATDARKQIMTARRESFFSTELPELFRQMQQLGIFPDDIIHAWNEQGEAEAVKE